MAEPKTTPPILQFVGTVQTSATTAPFVVREKFVKNIGHDAPVKIYGLGSSFDEWFLKGGGKIEEPIASGTLRYATLLKAVTDLPQKPGDAAIIPELGGEARAETTLTEVYDLMVKQANGEDGVLLTDGRVNIFYVPDINDALRAVCVDWCGDGCLVIARSVSDPYGWHDGRRVFSRDFLESSVTAA